MHIRVSITNSIKTKTSVINVIGLFPYTFNSPFRYFGFVSVFRFRFGKSRYPCGLVIVALPGLFSHLFLLLLIFFFFFFFFCSQGERMNKIFSGSTLADVVSYDWNSK